MERDTIQELLLRTTELHKLGCCMWELNMSAPSKGQRRKEPGMPADCAPEAHMWESHR